MIKINLAARKQAMGTEPKGGGGLGGLSVPGGISKLNLDFDQIRELPIRRFLLPIIVAFAISYTSDNYKDDEMKKAEDALSKVTADRSQLEKEAGKFKQYEELKKSLERDESTMRTKIDTIQKLIADRQNPPKILMSIATATPKDLWLSEFRLANSGVTVRGYSLTFNSISDFMKNLNDSAYFTDTSLKKSEQGKDPTGLDAASFELTAKRR